MPTKQKKRKSTKKVKKTTRRRPVGQISKKEAMLNARIALLEDKILRLGEKPLASFVNPVPEIVNLKSEVSELKKENPNIAKTLNNTIEKINDDIRKDRQYMLYLTNEFNSIGRNRTRPKITIENEDELSEKLPAIIYASPPASEDIKNFGAIEYIPSKSELPENVNDQIVDILNGHIGAISGSRAINLGTPEDISENGKKELIKEFGNDGEVEIIETPASSSKTPLIRPVNELEFINQYLSKTYPEYSLGGSILPEKDFIEKWILINKGVKISGGGRISKDRRAEMKKEAADQYKLFIKEGKRKYKAEQKALEENE